MATPDLRTLEGGGGDTLPRHLPGVQKVLKRPKVNYENVTLGGLSLRLRLIEPELLVHFRREYGQAAACVHEEQIVLDREQPSYDLLRGVVCKHLQFSLYLDDDPFALAWAGEDGLGRLAQFADADLVMLARQGARYQLLFENAGHV